MAAPAKKLAVPDARRDMEKELAAAGALKHQLREAFGDESDPYPCPRHGRGRNRSRRRDRQSAGTDGLGRRQYPRAGKVRKHDGGAAQASRDRVETMRTMLLNALDIVEVSSIDRPIARVTRKSLPPKLHIVDEAAIPTRFFTQPEPVLSKSALTETLKSRRDTLEQKTKELDARLAAGEIGASAFAEALTAVHAAFPAIPGAELDNGSATIQVRWS
jgi:hypothetical protein